VQSEAESVVQPSTEDTTKSVSALPNVTESVSELPQTEIDEQPSADEDCGADCYYSSGDEYVPSDLEPDRKCNMCNSDVFIARPLSNCLALLCYEHRLTECSEHRETDLSAARAKMLLSRFNKECTSSDTDDASSSRVKRKIKNSLVKKSAEREERKSTRKRKSNCSRWHRVKSKKALEMGQKYINSKSEAVPVKTVPEGDLCSEKCRRHCTLKVLVSVRQQIFGSFYSLDTNSQNCYLFSNIEPCRPQMQRVSAKSHRSMSFRYRLIADGEVTYVCKKAFARLHGITLSKIRHLTDKMKSGATAPHACERGTHRNRPNRVLPEAAEQVIKHIKLFPAESFHYFRKKMLLGSICLPHCPSKKCTHYTVNG